MTEPQKNQKVQNPKKSESAKSKKSESAKPKKNKKTKNQKNGFLFFCLQKRGIDNKINL